jgi:hypothetical protein
MMEASVMEGMEGVGVINIFLTEVPRRPGGDR